MSGASRRDTLASLAGFLAVPAIATGATAGVHPDAALLARGPALAALKAEMDAREVEVWRTDEMCRQMTPPRPPPGDPARERWGELWRAALDASGYTAAWDAFDDAAEPLIGALAELGEMRASTIAGLCLKAQYVEHCEALTDSIVDDLRAIGASRQA